MNSNSIYKYLLCAVIAGSIWSSLYSQASGSVHVIADSEFHSVLNKKLTHDVYNSGYMGHRIQIYFDAGNNSKQGAYNVAELFYKQYPDIPVYVTFKEPYYRVRVGDFRTKLDADKLLNSINKTFKGAFWVKEFISIFDEPFSPSNIYQDPLITIPEAAHETDNVRDDAF